VNGNGPSVLTMVVIVAVSVAAVILVFFGIGYAFGRLFL
jgi:preprotein translocase subunit SecE